MSTRISTKTGLAIALLVASSSSAAVQVSFSGVLDQFNVGPYGEGTQFGGSFTPR